MRRRRALSIAFIAAINLPLVAMVLDVDPTPLFGRLAPAPHMPTSPRDAFRLPGLSRAYYSDHFGFRASLLRLHGNLVPALFGTSGSTKVLLGEDDWLFLQSEQVLDDYRRLDPFTEVELEGWVRLLKARAAFCRERGVAYLFVVGPNKHTVYADKLPGHLVPQERPSRLDELLARLEQENAGVQVLDLRASLKERSRQARTYHRTDTHWNQVGAAVAAADIAKALQARGLDVPGLHVDLSQVERDRRLGGDLARMMGAKIDRPEVQLMPTVSAAGQPVATLPRDDPEVGDVVRLSTTSTTGKLKAVVFHDSFGDALRPFLTSQFAQVSFAWGDDFRPELVQEHQPQVVIQVLAERRLFNSAPNLEELKAPEAEQ